MALWLDKYRPKKLNKLDFHKKQAEHLEKLVKTGDFPHLLVISFDSICTLRVNQMNLLNIQFFRFMDLQGQARKLELWPS